MPKLQFTTDVAKALADQAKLNAKIGELTERLREAGRAGKKSAEDMESAFGGAGESIADAVSRIGASVLSIGAVVDGLRRVVTHVREIENAAGGRITDAASGRSALAQIAGSPADFAALTKRVSSLRGQFGFDATRASKLVFDAASTNLLNDAEFFAKLNIIGIDPSVGIRSTQLMQSAFGGADAGSARQVMAKALAAAGPSPVQTGAIASAASVASAAFAAAGGRDEELLASLSILAETFKSPDVAAERLKSAAEVIDAKRGLLPSDLQNAPLLDIMARLPGAKLFDKPEFDERGRRVRNRQAVSLQEFVGSKEALSAIRLVAGREGDIRSRMADVLSAEAAPDALLGARFGIAETDPALRATLLAAQRKQRLEMLHEEESGVAEVLADAASVQAEIDTRLRSKARGGGRFSRGVDDLIGRGLRGVDRMIDAPADFAAREGDAEIRSAAQELRDAAKALTESARAMPRQKTLSRPDYDPGIPQPHYPIPGY